MSYQEQVNYMAMKQFAQNNKHLGVVALAKRFGISKRIVHRWLNTNEEIKIMVPKLGFDSR